MRSQTRLGNERLGSRLRAWGVVPSTAVCAFWHCRGSGRIRGLDANSGLWNSGGVERMPSSRPPLKSKSTHPCLPKLPERGRREIDRTHCYSSFTSGFRCLSRQRCTSSRQLGGAGNSFRVSVSTEPGQSRVLTCTNAKSVEPTPIISQAPKEAAARVQA